MTKGKLILKKIVKITLWVVAIFVLFLVLIAGLIQLPYIQNKIVKSATSFVSDKTHTLVEIKSVRIAFPKSVVIKGIYLEDLKKDTLIYAGEVNVNMALFDLLFHKIDISSFGFKDVTLKLNRTSTDSLFNYNFLITAFADSSKSLGQVSQPSKWKFKVNNLILRNIRLDYDDKYGGMNLRASLKDLYLKMNAMDFDKSKFKINEFRVSGLQANIRLKETMNAKEKKSTGVAPELSAKNILVINSLIRMDDQVNKQSISAEINKFHLKGGLVDLEKELVSLNQFTLSKSKIQYNKVESSKTLNKTSEQSKSIKNGWNVTVRNVEMSDNSLSYNLTNKPLLKSAFDANHINLKYFTLVAKNIHYSSTLTEAQILQFNAIDRNNFNITKFETDFRMDQQSIKVGKLIAKTANSDLNADIAMRFVSLESLKKSLSSLYLNIDLKTLSIRSSDVLYFNPQLGKLPFFRNRMNVTMMKGLMSGTLNHLKGENIIVKTGNNTTLNTDFNITGLPKFETATFNFPNLKVTTGNQDIEMLAGPSIPKNLEMPSDISIHANFMGQIKSFKTNISLNSSYGSAYLNANIDPQENYNGNIGISHFDMGRLMKDKAMFGPVTLTANLKGHGLDKNNIDADFDTEVSQVYINNYLYHNLNAQVKVAGREVDGAVKINDEFISLDALFNLNSLQERYKFNLNVQGADLQKLNLTKEDYRIAFNANADLKGGMTSRVAGGAGITNLILVHSGKRYMLDSVLTVIINGSKTNKVVSGSSLIAIKYNGSAPPAQLPKQLSGFVNNYFAFSDIKSSKKKIEMSDFDFEVQLHNHPILSEVLFPQLKVFEPGIIQFSYDSINNDLKMSASINRIVYGSTELDNVAVQVNSDSTALNYKISSSNLINTQIELDNFLFDGKIEDNSIQANISSIDGNTKNLMIHSQITRDKTNYKLVLDPGEFYLMSKRWDIDSNNFIEFGKEGLLIHHLFLNHLDNQIRIASVHDKFKDDVNIDIKNFKLEDISQIVEKDTSIVSGSVDGTVLLKRVNDSYGIIANAQIKDLYVKEVPIGNVSLIAVNPTSEKFNIDLRLSGNQNNMTVNGSFIPNGGDNSINIRTDINSLSMATIQAFSMGRITEGEGKITGNLLIQGKISEPEITGTVAFENAFIKPAMLNNRLELRHETILLRNDGLYFNNFTLLDVGKHAATINGSIQMKHFKNFIFALHVRAKDFMLFNSTSKENKEFFGRMIIDSNLDLTGPFTLPVVNARLKLKKGSNFTFAVPEDKLTTDKGEDVIDFNNSLKSNPILNRKEINTEEKTNIKGFDLSSVIEIDKQATLRLLMDPSSSDSLVVKGEAALSFTMDRSGKMSLTGTYNLTEGSYMITFESIIKKRFDIVSGSTITWNGDPMDADININATYTQRAAPIDLVADQISGLSETDKGAYKQPYAFLVVLKLRGAILHPEISFEIQLRPEDKGILGGAVNQKLTMLNEDPSTLNKQVFALLVLGRFVQDNPLQTESGGTESIVRSTVGNFLSSELNKLSSKVVPGVELNFDIQSYTDYGTGQGQGRTQVGIGIKKQLFKERLSVQVGGNIDVEGPKAQQNSASDITSDITVEYKLTEDGRYRLKAFRHNQYEGAIDGQLIENGAGVVYVNDFNKWKDFFKSSVKKSSSKTVNNNDSISTK